jgi:hypothetical protein
MAYVACEAADAVSDDESLRWYHYRGPLDSRADYSPIPAYRQSCHVHFAFAPSPLPPAVELASLPVSRLPHECDILYLCNTPFTLAFTVDGSNMGTGLSGLAIDQVMLCRLLA